MSRGAASKALSKEGFHLVFASLVQFIDSPSIECFVDADHTLSASFFCPVGRSDTPLSWISLSDFSPDCCCCWAICQASSICISLSQPAGDSAQRCRCNHSGTVKPTKGPRRKKFILRLTEETPGICSRFR